MRIRKIMAVTMAACLVAGSLAGCGKKTEEKVIKIADGSVLFEDFDQFIFAVFQMSPGRFPGEL